MTGVKNERVPAQTKRRTRSVTKLEWIFITSILTYFFGIISKVLFDRYRTSDANAPHEHCRDHNDCLVRIREMENKQSVFDTTLQDHKEYVGKQLDKGSENFDKIMESVRKIEVSLSTLTAIVEERAKERNPLLQKDRK